MPFGGGKSGTTNVSGLVWDDDLKVSGGHKIQVDHIAEFTASHGVEIDSDLGTNARGQIMTLGGA